MRTQAATLLASAALWLSSACGASSTPPILTPPLGPHDCARGWDHCVANDPSSPSGLSPTGWCCPETYACGGGFPNVGCAPGSCCPTQSGGVSGGLDAQRAPVRQIREGSLAP